MIALYKSSEDGGGRPLRDVRREEEEDDDDDDDDDDEEEEEEVRVRLELPDGFAVESVLNSTLSSLASRRTGPRHHHKSKRNVRLTMLMPHVSAAVIGRMVFKKSVTCASVMPCGRTQRQHARRRTRMQQDTPPAT